MSDLLTSRQMASFVARGFLAFEAIVPETLNQRFLADVGDVDPAEISSIADHYAKVMSRSTIPVVAAGTPLQNAYPSDSALGELIKVPQIAGAIASLVGEGCVFDHHFLHITFPPHFSKSMGQKPVSQHTHQDSTIDPRKAFDIQLLYFPHKVVREMGGTRYLPGSHLRRVSEAAIGRYQNIRGQQHVVCEAGTVIVFHHGMWHGGGVNQSDALRYMFKIRLAPAIAQHRLWDTSDLPNDHAQQRPIFWLDPNAERDPIHATLTQPEPWFEYDTGRLEYLNRIRMWRYLLGDASFDADYWLTRVENEFA
ncbi:MAG: phytanoyl-CoA dioxygenase family protein [Proteobacteria bacterium]|nr:phytanoyl-CoA dioxygenase family protein [Pseudomonadota bacterium]